MYETGLIAKLAPSAARRATIAAMKFVTALGLSAVTLALASACSSSTQSQPVTFHKDVEPILQAHCQSCHVAGGIAPFPLVTFADAKPMAPMLALATASKKMPPWGATESAACAPRFGWTHDPRLSTAQIATLDTWSKTGTLEGNLADAPPPVDARPGLPGVQMELQPAGPYAVSATSSDAFRCFVLDPKLAQDTWVSGANVIPGNAEIVHHVILFTDPAGESAKKKLGADGGYECFGGIGVQDTSILMAWAPGMQAQEFPPNVGTKLTAGTQLVMQVHYHPHTVAAATSDKPDLTRAQLRFNPATPEYALVSLLLGNFDKTEKNGDGFVYDSSDPQALPTFVIPAGAKGRTVTQRVTLPPTLDGKNALPTLRIYGIGGHMHWVGTKVEITAHRLTPLDPEPQDECLLGIPNWDFNWQRVYHYDTDIETLPSLRQFDQVTLKCTYDNTLQNSKVQLALSQQGLKQPADVKLGETTLDEMCLGIFQLVAKVAP